MIYLFNLFFSYLFFKYSSNYNNKMINYDAWEVSTYKDIKSMRDYSLKSDKLIKYVYI